MGFFNSLLSFASKIAAIGLLALSALVGVLSAHILVKQPVATSSSPSTQTATTTSRTTAASHPVATAPKSIPKISLNLTVAIPPAPTPVAQPTPSESSEEVNDQTRAALVNILCTTQAGGSFSPISGSGVIIDSRGIVLTNAHVGQFFLLRNYGVQNNIVCILRTGSPATPAYTATLMYLPPAWIQANASQITAPQATGTGQNDYSFLLITGTTDPGTTLPATFPSLTMSANITGDGEPVLLAAYPAGFLGGETIEMNLYVTSALTAIQQLYTFDDPAHVDAVGVGGTVVSQSGSSGGAVVDLSDGKLIGIISTDTASSTTAGRELDAITISHIDRSLAAEGQGGIVALLSQDATQAAANFASTTAPSETQALEAVLNKQ